MTFILDLPGLLVNPPQRSFVWLEDVHREEFHVKAAAALDGCTVRGTLRVHVGPLLVAEVALTIRVDGTAARPIARDAEAVVARPYRRIFPSYSHLDSRIVRQLEAYARTLGDTYLRDITQIRAGEVWSARVADFIREADIFQLFWSRNSMVSPSVRQEWEYALSLGRSSFIRPTYWETPMPEAPEHGLPPAALRALHFHRLPVRLQTEASRGPAPTPGGPETEHRGVAEPQPPSSSPSGGVGAHAPPSSPFVSWGWWRSPFAPWAFGRPP
jgi:hypothetical protein